jgi:hypothetical protein
VPEAGAGWSSEEAWWRDHFRARPYARPDRDFEHYRHAYRHGWEAAQRGRNEPGWSDVESEMRYGWENRADRTPDWSAWEEIKDAARDAWERARGRRE